MESITSMIRLLIVVIVVTFVVQVISNIFGIFPWAIGIVTTTNAAAKESSTYNTFFKETRLAMEKRLTNLPEAVETPPASEWFPKESGQFESALSGGSDSNGNNLGLDALKVAQANILNNSKVVMIEAHGYNGISYEQQVQPSNLNQQQIEATLYDQSKKIGKYLDPIDIYTFAVYPLYFKIGTTNVGKLTGKEVLIPWVYHASSVGLHLYRETEDDTTTSTP